MTFELAINNNDKLAHERIFDKSILICNSFTLWYLHEFSTKDLSISCVLHEDSIWLHEFLVPKEDVVLVAMTNRAIETTLWTLSDFYNLIHC